jgi:hypothetical protein
MQFGKGTVIGIAKTCYSRMTLHVPKAAPSKQGTIAEQYQCIMRGDGKIHVTKVIYPVTKQIIKQRTTTLRIGMTSTCSYYNTLSKQVSTKNYGTCKETQNSDPYIKGKASNRNCL